MVRLDGDLAAMRLAVLCQDLPFPATDGGRVDEWNRIRGLSELGHELLVVVWSDSARAREAADAARLALESIGVQGLAVSRRRSVFRALHPAYPPRMRSFIPPPAEQRLLLERVRQFRPELVLLDGWSAYLVALRIADALGLPLVYRSHNWEADYYRGLVKSAAGLARLKLMLTAVTMVPAERRIRARASLVLEISAEDGAEWARQGSRTPSYVLPASFLGPFSRVRENTTPDWDVLYAGNLWTPHNVTALRWFVAEVLPKLQARGIQSSRVCFAGSAPSRELSRVAAAAGIVVVADPPVLEESYSRARVLINPVQRSSGMNVKMIGMLAAGLPVVSTGAGLRGLPGEVREMAMEASSAESFAAAILRALAGEPDLQLSSRAGTLEDLFGLPALRRLMARLERLTRGKVGAGTSRSETQLGDPPGSGAVSP